MGVGLIGFVDDYIKVFRKHKEGLKGRFKVIGQVGLGLIVGVTLYVSDDVLIREKVSISEVGVVTSTVDEGFVSENSQTVLTKDIKSTKTTIPFFKNNEFDYAWFGALFGDYAEEIGWIVFIIITIVIVTAVSNGANLTGGLDGLGTGAAGRGGAVGTTIHSMSCEATYRRMVSLCKRAVDMSDETLMGFVTEAYPIIAFCKQLENKERRLMEIMECEILADGTRRYRPLFQYQITENRVEDGKFVIVGHHRQINPISDSLARRLMENGMPQETLAGLLNVKKDREGENG